MKFNIAPLWLRAWIKPIGRWLSNALSSINTLTMQMLKFQLWKRTEKKNATQNSMDTNFTELFRLP